MPTYANDQRRDSRRDTQEITMLIPIAIIVILVGAYALSFDKFSDAFRKTDHHDKAGS